VPVKAGQTLPPALIGVMFLGDMTRPGLEPAALAGFLLAVASAVMLARFGEAEQAARGAPGRAAAGAATAVAARPAPAGERRLAAG
jgi:hypothetical protein